MPGGGSRIKVSLHFWQFSRFEQMSETKERLAIILNTASFERVSYALGIAATEQALNREVYLLFGHGALIRLKKGFTDKLAEETSSWLREQMRKGLNKGAIQGILESLKDFKKLGGRIYACPTAMSLHGISQDELIEEVDAIRGVVAFLSEEAKGASKVIYI